MKSLPMRERGLKLKEKCRMSDLKEDYDLMKEHKKQLKNERITKNLAYLKDNEVLYEIVDARCEHILINGELDYYLGSTYWFDRKSHKHGYAMLSKLKLSDG